MATRALGPDLLPLVDRLFDVLNTEPDPVRRQQAIELLAAGWAMQCAGDEARFVADSMHKHVLQIMRRTPIDEHEL